MTWTNYHSHCLYCDGKEKPEEYILKAIESGIIAYGFSSHAPLPWDTYWTMKPENLANYYSEINLLKEKYKDQIQIYCGLEVDFIPGISGPDSFKKTSGSLDYTIGSVHYVDWFFDGSPINTDGTHDEFFKGLQEVFLGDVKKFICRYYEIIRQMVEYDCPDVIGHLDKIKIHNRSIHLFDEKDTWYIKEIMQTLEVIKSKNVIVEINTRGFYKKIIDDFYPGKWILKEMNAMNIPVTINSDTHASQEIIGGFPEIADFLTEIGYKKVSILFNGEWIESNLGPIGLLI